MSWSLNKFSQLALQGIYGQQRREYPCWYLTDITNTLKISSPIRSGLLSSHIDASSPKQRLLKICTALNDSLFRQRPIILCIQWTACRSKAICQFGVITLALTHTFKQKFFPVWKEITVSPTYKIIKHFLPIMDLLNIFWMVMNLSSLFMNTSGTILKRNDNYKKKISALVCEAE